MFTFSEKLSKRFAGFEVTVVCLLASVNSTLQLPEFIASFAMGRFSIELDSEVGKRCCVGGYLVNLPYQRDNQLILFLGSRCWV